LGGAIGNLTDRVRYGEVIDFIDLYVGQYHWPVFNVADSGITVGMLMLLGHALFHRQPDVRPAADP
jgi:signal peptidase II